MSDQTGARAPQVRSDAVGLDVQEIWAINMTHLPSS
jgi:hypothetical protein